MKTFFHGSPYNFDKFDISKIGTGDERQKYGYGLYFTDSMETARQYAEDLTLRGHDGYNVYEVKLLGLSDYQNWDEPIYSIFDTVIEELEDLGKEDDAEQLREESSEDNGYDMWTFGSLYEWLSYVMGDSKGAAEFLYNKVGVTGVVARNAWLDGNIYVAFSDGDVKILDKYKIKNNIQERMKNNFRSIIREEIERHFKGVLEESKGRYEYQVRDIDGNVYYKRKVGAKYWEFTTEKDFKKNMNDDNVIAWIPSLNID